MACKLSNKELSYLKPFLIELTNFKVSNFKSLDISINQDLINGIKGKEAKENLKLILPTTVSGVYFNGHVRKRC